MKPLFVLDASVGAGWIFQDQAAKYYAAVLQRLTTAACIAPSLWQLEMANILLVAERKGKFSRFDAEQAVHALHRLPIEIEDDTGFQYLGGVRDLGREFSLSAYDAVYLDLTLRMGLPLGTRNEALAAAVIKAGASV